MRQWNRSTVSCEAEAFPEDALARYIDLHGCQDLLAGVLACVETVSDLVKPPRFGRTPRQQRSLIAVTSRYLVWASGEEGSEAVAAARLQDLEVADYRSPVVEDVGLDVVGFRTGATERESWFLPLDEGADGPYFRSQLRSAMTSASGHS